MELKGLEADAEHRLSDQAVQEELAEEVKE